MKKRVISYIVSFVMSATMVMIPSGIFAGEIPETGGNGVIESVSAVHYNPLYEGIIDEAALCAGEEASTLKSEADSNTAPILENGGYLTTEAAAAKALRDGMETRQETIILNYKTTDLDESGQLVYDIFNAALEHTGDPTEGDYLQWHWGSWSAAISGIVSDGVYELKLTYRLKYHTTAAQEAKVDKEVNKILSSLKLSGKSDYLKTKTIYDYISSSVTYDNAHLYDDTYTLKHTAYAAFINDTAVCQGYALMFYRLALEAGVDARIIAGDFNSKYTGPEFIDDNHGWNIVKIGKKYYNLDVTWDAGKDAYHYFLLGKGFDKSHIRWTYYTDAAFHKAYPMSASDYTPSEDDFIIDPSAEKIPASSNESSGASTGTADSENVGLAKVSKPVIVKHSKSKIRIGWKNIQGETGYQIARSSKKKGTYKVIKTVKGADAVGSVIKAKKKKTFYYKVRAYKKVNGKKIYGPWSAAGKYKLK